MSDLYQCVLCHQLLVFDRWTSEGRRSGCLVCKGCGEMYELRFGALNAIKNPSPYLLEAVRRAQVRRQQEEMHWTEFIIQRSPQLPEFKSLQIHQLNFEGVMNALSWNFSPHGRMLQVGCRETTYFMRWFRSHEHHSFGCGLHLLVTDEMFEQIDHPETPQFAVTDLEALPYQDNAFDFVLVSHTLLHSDALEKTCEELYRILKPGAVAVIINEPLKGLLDPCPEKQKQKIEPRREGMPQLKTAREIAATTRLSENSFGLWDYAKALHHAGFRRFSLFFPEHHHQLLKLGRYNSFRHKWLAWILCRCWKWRWLRRFIRKNFLLAGQLLFGMTLNIAIYKPRQKPPGLGSIFSELTWPPRLPWDLDPPPDAVDNLPLKLPERGDVGRRRAPERDRSGRRSSDEDDSR